ncbi:MAG: PAS domain S-box protein [Acidobacteria bacterium]|nr:PAS domain S-box protein [Acidobacteriota bacterium]
MGVQRSGIAAANLLSDNFPLIVWMAGTVLAGGLVVGFSLYRKTRQRSQKLADLWEDCEASHEELRRSNQQLRALIQSAPLAVIVLDCEGNVTTWNPEAERMFGWSAEDVLGRPLSAIPDGRWTTYREIAVRLQNGEVIQGREVEPRRKDGTGLTVSLSVSPLRDPAGQMSGCMAIAMDITQCKRAEKAVQASEERYRDLFENAKDIMYTRNMQGRVTSVNKETERVTRYSREELLGMNILELIAPEDRPALEQFICDGGSKASQSIREVEIITKDGQRVPLQVNARVIYRKAEAVEVVAICRDLSQQKQLQAQLWQAQKMEAVGRLAGGVAHDFNNLLNVIGGYSEMLLEDSQEGSDFCHYAQEIRKAADQAASVTRQLLAFSRKQILQPKVLDLKELLSDLGKMLRRLIGEDVQLSTVLQPALGAVKADPSQLEQVIMNLAVNARDAMPQGGRLMIETSNVVLDEEYARMHPPCQPGPYVLLVVSDTGIGMSQQVRAQIFEPFFTTKPMGKGTGLGLATVYGIVKQSGGYIWVYSEPGRGTTFKIYLPRAEGIAEASPSPINSASLPKGSETVLIVEDEPAVRELAREFLESSGYRVLDADCGAAALALARQQHGPIHLLLTDVIMPQMNGKELAGELGRFLPATKVLYMSGYTDEMIAHHGILKPGIHFLQKPFTREALAKKVREALE